MEEAKMQQISIPRILFAAPSSGSGKTTLTCGVINALRVRKKKVCSIKMWSGLYRYHVSSERTWHESEEYGYLFYR